MVKSILYDSNGSIDPWIDFSLGNVGLFGEIVSLEPLLSFSPNVELNSHSITYDYDGSTDPLMDHSLKGLGIFSEIKPTTYESSSFPNVEFDSPTCT